MGAYVRVTSKGQLTIPKEVRDKANIQEGTECYVTARNGEVIVIPRQGKLADLIGFLGEPPKGKGSTLEEIDRTVREAVGRHVLGLDAEDDE